jgi:8-oxo-dGTP pyrophosphatase MutT (NUDIX family)
VSSRATPPVRAAVLVPLLHAADEEPTAVVLTRRRTDLRRHAGEISFPGGREDAQDTDLFATALREAEEEVGLPRDAVSLIGELPATPTYATNYVIYPYVGAIVAPERWEPSPREVDAVLELSLEDLARAKTRTRLTRRGVTFETESYVIGEHLIWGATARILGHLFERMDSLTAVPNRR